MIMISVAVIAARFLTVYIYICEFTVESVAKHMFTIGFILFALRVLFEGLINEHDPENTAFYIFIASIVINFISQFIAIFYIPESPYFLYFTHKCDDFYDCLARMKRYNDPNDP